MERSAGAAAHRYSVPFRVSPLAQLTPGVGDGQEIGALIESDDWLCWSRFLVEVPVCASAKIQRESELGFSLFLFLVVSEVEL